MPRKKGEITVEDDGRVVIPTGGVSLTRAEREQAATLRRALRGVLTEAREKGRVELELQAERARLGLTPGQMQTLLARMASIRARKERRVAAAREEWRTMLARREERRRQARERRQRPT